jgi:hypothetical protein
MSIRKLKRRAYERWEWAFANDPWRGMEHWLFDQDPEDLWTWISKT